MENLTAADPNSCQTSRPWVCIVCGCTFGRGRNMLRHVEYHDTGKASAIAASLAGSGRQQQHPVVMEAIPALYENDVAGMFADAL